MNQPHCCAKPIRATSRNNLELKDKQRTAKISKAPVEKCGQRTRSQNNNNNAIVVLMMMMICKVLVLMETNQKITPFHVYSGKVEKISIFLFIRVGYLQSRQTVQVCAYSLCLISYHSWTLLIIIIKLTRVRDSSTISLPIGQW